MSQPDFTTFVHDLLREYHDALEEACEQALQSGYCGVRVTWHGNRWAIEVTPEVPYGTIHEVHP